MLTFNVFQPISKRTEDDLVSWRAIIKLHRYKISFSASLSHISLANEQLGVFSSQLIFMSLKQLVDYDNFN